MVTTLAVLLSAAIATSTRWGPDWPAQEFRTWSAAHDGLTAWTNRWYSGQALPGYSVLYPLISVYPGAAATGFGAVVAATFGARRLAPAAGSSRIGFQVSVAVILAADLLIGQIPYLVGVGFGVWALDATLRRRSLLAAVLAAACALASPLAGLFLLLAIPALACSRGVRRSASLLTAGMGIGVASVFGGATGPGPFSPSVALAATATTVVLAVVAVRAGLRYRPIAVFGATMLLAVLASYLVANPVGGNVARLSQLAVVPLLWHVLPTARLRQPVALVLVALCAVWPISPAATAVVRGASDPSRGQGYYTGLVRFLGNEDPRQGRLEVPFTREHWESSWVARAFPIARGWERQTDLDVNSVLYRPLSALSYRRWLDDNAVSLIALPDVPLDAGGQAEAALLVHPPSYLQPVWAEAHWRVWRVRNHTPILRGPAALTRLGPASVTMRFRQAGSATLRIRTDPMWSVTSGPACIEGPKGSWLRVRAHSAGVVVLRARATLSSVTGRPRCH